jgi:hypothetical protein
VIKKEINNNKTEYQVPPKLLYKKSISNFQNKNESKKINIKVKGLGVNS